MNSVEPREVSLPVGFVTQFGVVSRTIFGQDDPSRLGAGGSGRGGGNDLAVGIRARARGLPIKSEERRDGPSVSLIQNLVLRGNQRIEVRYLSINEEKS